MKRIRITHTTVYHYRQPVTFGNHRALMRPLEGHAAHIARGRVEIEPKASVRWLRDLNGNSVAILEFAEPARLLRVFSEVVYIPGAGWQGFDPTNNKLVGNEHIPVAVAPSPAEASPLSGFWEGPSDAFERMEVSVQVVALGAVPNPLA